MNTFKNCVTIVLIGAVVLLVMSNIEAGSQTPFTCVLCRLHRADTAWLGLRRTTFAENECSTWYRAHVEPAHAHMWEQGTCTTRLSALGFPSGVACRTASYSIQMLTPRAQMGVYQHFPDPKKARDLFAGLTDARMQSTRDSNHAEAPQAYFMLNALAEWAAANFPGTWDDWRQTGAHEN